MAAIKINSLRDTAKIGAFLGRNLGRYNNPALFLRGELGAGKTALARYITQAMPGGKEAEIGSPSFNICNYYPTSPPTLHCDLYRCQSFAPEEVLAEIEANACQAIVEWAEFFPPEYLPASYLDIDLILDKNTRLLIFNAYGVPATALLENLLGMFGNAGEK